MVNFSTKLFALAGSALVFAGVALGQGTCTAGAPSTSIIRAEGVTELIPPTTFNCTAGINALGGTVALQVFVNPALPITSKILDTGTGTTEAVAYTGTSFVYGKVSGSTVQFSNLPVPSGAFTVTVANIRVNATSLSVAAGQIPTIAETVFVSGSTGSILPAVLSFATVAIAQNGLAPAKSYKSFSSTLPSTLGQVVVGSSGANSYVICNGYNQSKDPYTGASTSTTPKSLAFIVQVNEGTVAAFKSAKSEASTVPIGAGIAGGISGATANTVTNGTRIKLTFANVPANVTLLVPVGPITSAVVTGATSGASITLTASETGSQGSVSASGASAVNGAALASITLTSGGGTAVFEVITDDPNNYDQFNIPVFIDTTSNSVAGSSTAITTTVSLAPIGSTTNIPSFSSTSSSTTLTGSTFALCTTSLLFPFVTNQLGFDTGLAIANTSTDPFGASGATAQAGTCTLNFYGAGAPSPSNIVTPNVPSGTVYTQVLSGVAAGFQGYMIAQCSFQFAHGFAFITDGVGTNGGLSQGYLAGVIPDVNQTSRSANPAALAGSGSGETLGN